MKSLKHSSARLALAAIPATLIITAYAFANGRADCWMTGGGSVFDTNGGEVTWGDQRVTHGFELHCDGRPNNLEINFHGQDTKFKLTSLTSAICIDSPGIDPNPPGASFDTYIGSGTGRYGAGNGAPGFCANWIFTDAGEPGTADTATIEITDCAGTTVASVSGPLLKGNHQAHSQD